MFVKFVSFLNFVICFLQKRLFSYLILYYFSQKELQNYVSFRLHKAWIFPCVSLLLLLSDKRIHACHSPSLGTPKSIKWNVSETSLLTPWIFWFTRSYVRPGHLYFWKVPQAVLMFGPGSKLLSWDARDASFGGHLFFLKVGHHSLFIVKSI